MKYPKVALILVLLGVSNPVLGDPQIAFYSDREGGTPGGYDFWSVFVMNPDGSNPVNLTKRIGVDTLPSRSPDKSKYLFWTEHDRQRDIFMIDPDGSNLLNLTNDPGSDSSPRWSPDGRRILWNRWPPGGLGGAEIFVMNTDGSNPHNLGRGIRPKWSPDGSMIGFTLDGRQDNALVMNADGGGRRQVTDELFPTRFISWSRDGTKVAFDHRKPFGFVQNKVFIVNVDGTGLFELTKDVPEVDCYGGAWSPDGTKIAITSTGGIYVLNSDGTNPINITIHHDNRWGVGPRWSPDGTKIMYEITEWIGDMHHGEIYIMNSDGSDPINITNHPAHDCCGVWWVNPSSTLVEPQEKLIATWGEIKAVGSSQ
ncbi:MAG: hypothetical protein OXN17_15430 [Candidatus Poribacteria bacterium]|nr:hypothetical protein [Candidatus Poribacteria bacterium]MDE0504289.1 hypothetical protein [Candidatus Poribacteria bacterium]